MITTNARCVKKYDSQSGYVSYVIFQTEEVIEFSEWQFVMIEVKHNWKKMKNPYSIATTNTMMIDEKHIWVVVKKTSDHGLSHYMTHTMQIWDTLAIKWPVGHYTDSQTNQNYLFVSVWSGLSPNLGLFHHLAYESREFNTIVNIFWERFHKHIVPAIHDLFYDHGQEHIHNLMYLSQETETVPWYTKGYVQDGLEQAISLLWINTSCFLCGKPEMVDDVRQRLETLWIDKEDITFEKY